MSTMRLAVHDRRRLVREGLSLLLGDEADLVVIDPTDHDSGTVDVVVVGPDAEWDDAAVSSARVVSFDDATSIEMILAAVRSETGVGRRKSARPGAAHHAMTLTPREVEILTRIARGFSTREMSEQLGLSPKTIENHKRRIFGKLDVQNQAHAVAVATRAGLLEGC